MDNLVKIDPFGFREYDARWLYPGNINLEGIVNLGKGLETNNSPHKKNNPRVVVGHDYRSYSKEIKENLKGLIPQDVSWRTWVCLSTDGLFRSI